MLEIGKVSTFLAVAVAKPFFFGGPDHAFPAPVS
jgi:hypothetical protein